MLMAGDQTMRLQRRVEYSDAVGEMLCEHLADGGTIREFVRAYPELCTSSLCVARWRAQIPAFDEMVRVAQRVGAEAQLERALEAACDPLITAPKARAEAAVRLRMAAVADRSRYGPVFRPASGGDGGYRPAHVVSDSELLLIARGETTLAQIEDQRGSITIPAGGGGEGGAVDLRTSGNRGDSDTESSPQKNLPPVLAGPVPGWASVAPGQSAEAARLEALGEGPDSEGEP